MARTLNVEYKMRMSSDLKDKISQAAKENNRSMNAEILKRLEDSFCSMNYSSAFINAIDTNNLDSSIEQEDKDFFSPIDIIQILKEMQKTQEALSQTAHELKIQSKNKC